MSAADSRLDRPSVLGFVEARTVDRILGWAWDAAEPEARVTVALMDGETVLAEVRADRPREDLARSGVGDGAHAFEIAVPETLHRRAGSLAVVARGQDGRAVPLAAPPPAANDPPALARLQRGLDQVAAGQRAVLRALQALPAAANAEETLARITAAQQRLEAQLETLEVFVTRLDGRLAALAERDAVPATPRAALILAAGLGLAASVALGIALSNAL
jgi:hypothetical protein